VARLRFGKRVYLTKRPADLGAIAPRLRLDPHFHAVCLMRDPRDVVVSRHNKDRSRYWTPLRIWKERLPLVRRFSGHARFTLIRYEDLVVDPDAAARRLTDRLPFLELTHPFSAFPALAQPSPAAVDALGAVRPFDTASIGNWRNHLPRLAGQLAKYGPITDELVEFGYERDAGWLTALAGVTPDRAPSRLGLGRRRPWRRYLERSVLPWVSAGIVVMARKTGIPVA
jgi:hypothetical protein